MPNVTVALPNIGDVFCSTPQSLADAHYLTANTRNPLKFARVPQTRQQISAACWSKFIILWRHLEDISLLNRFFLIVDTCLRCENIPRQICAMVRRWRIFGDVFASCIFSVIARHSNSGRQPNFAAFSKGRHVYSSGRLSRWASVHILVLISILHGIISNFYFWGLFHVGIGRHSLFNPSPPQFSRSNSLYWHSLK